MLLILIWDLRRAVELIIAMLRITSSNLSRNLVLRMNVPMDKKQPLTLTRYSRPAVALHWAIAGLILITIPLGIYGADTDGGSGQAATNAHKTIGILILFLTVIRLAWRLGHRPPPLPMSLAPVLRIIARISHLSFYVLLLILPLSGWWMSSAVPERHSFGVGLFEIPFLPVPRGFGSAGPAHFVHVNLAFVMIGLVALHLLAVAKHHFIDRDTILTRMLPPKVYAETQQDEAV
jgi:cytochrome b561